MVEAVQFQPLNNESKSMERGRDRAEGDATVKQRKANKSIDRLMTLRGSIKAKQVKRTRETSPIDGSLRIQPLKADMGK